MPEVYLMRRFDMNESFPRPGPGKIEPYINCSFVLMHEDGGFIPLEKQGGGNAQGLSQEAIQKLKTLQGRGYQIRGDICPLYEGHNVINIEGDVEIFQPFVRDSAEDRLLLEHRVDVMFEEAN
ncbi:MAG: hypothetical protein RL557_899 [archaeon]